MEIEAKFAVPDEATWLRLQSIEQVAGYTLSVGQDEAGARYVHGHARSHASCDRGTCAASAKSMGRS